MVRFRPWPPLPNSMIRNGFRASPVDHPWASMADPRTIGKRVDATPSGPRRGGGAGELGTWKSGGLRDVGAGGRRRNCPPLHQSGPGRTATHPLPDSPRVGHRWARMVRGRCPEPVANHGVGKWWPGTESNHRHADQPVRSSKMATTLAVTCGIQIERRILTAAWPIPPRHLPLRTSLSRLVRVAPGRVTAIRSSLVSSVNAASAHSSSSGPCPRRS